jgi:transcription termination/antitermination protein NusA
MNSDLLAVLDYMEREKGIKREVLLEALSGALLTAAKKSVGPARDLRVTIDPKTGEITALANLVVADVVRSIHDEILQAVPPKVPS